MNCTLLFPLLCLFILTVGAENILLNPCDHASTCAECLEANGQCYWCADEDYTQSDSSKPRCNLRPNLKDCRNIQIADGETKDTISVAFGNKIQVTPQKVQVKLRPGQTQSFTLSVKPAQNYPVRIYYLMDMSKSMEDDLKKLQTLGTKIANEIKNITKDYKLAFGTFVDKTVTPFIQPGKLNDPCNGGCVPTFGYKHVFDFNPDAKLFEEAVADQKISGNLDTAEGGFDALMQVAACGKKIGWDPVGQSRRIVIFVTDASPHIAGDGKIGGITTPNDGACHLISNKYSKSNNLDYPSISQLRLVMKHNKIVPILAVTHDVVPIYEKIANEWKDLGAGIGTLMKDSSNIVDLIRDNYKKISTTIRLNDDSPGNIVVKYKVTGGCPKADPAKENECTEVGIGQKVDFRVSFTLTNCPENWKDGQRFTINVPGFGEVEVEASMICECECQKEGSNTFSPICNNQGLLKCGVCECPANRFGKFCECDGAAQADTSKCIMPNSKTICSGFGSCVCGVCECNQHTDKTKIIRGTYCQCNNFGCDRYDGKICGGEERGICKCGQCVCKEAFQGENCGQKNCTVGKRNCLKDGVECSGNGECDCDQCACKAGCKGAYCEKCVTSGKCETHEECVLCEYGIGDAELCSRCNEIFNVTYNRLDSGNDTEIIDPCGEEENLIIKEKCVVTVDGGREIHYEIEVDPNGQSNAKMFGCVKPIIYDDSALPIWMIIILIIGAIVFIALLLLLIWKVIVTIYDRREYAQFERDRMNPKWNAGVNPIYKGASSTYQNPMYKKNDNRRM